MKQNKIAVVNEMFWQSFRVRFFLNIQEDPCVDVFQGKKKTSWCLNNVIYYEVILLKLTLYTLEAMFITTEKNEAALSLLCELGIFSQDKFCPEIKVNLWEKGKQIFSRIVRVSKLNKAENTTDKQHSPR